MKAYAVYRWGAGLAMSEAQVPPPSARANPDAKALGLAADIPILGVIYYDEGAIQAMTWSGSPEVIPMEELNALVG